MKNLVELQIAEYDEEEHCTMHYFKVSRDWLENHLGDVGFVTIDTFLEEYTSSESETLYGQAVLENAIIDESFSK